MRNVALQQDSDAPSKRQRIQDEPSSVPVQTSSQVSSSLASRTILEAWLKPTFTIAQDTSSYVAGDTETPPSSPPAASQSDPDSPQLLKIRKPTFSFLRKQRNRPHSAPAPLSKSTSISNLQSQHPSRSTKLTQLTIDLGGPTTVSCPECLMSYTPSQPDDSALHAKYHSGHLAKLNITMEVWRVIAEKACWKDVGKGDYIVSISHESKQSLKNLTERTLAIASQDLGAVEIPKAQLWGLQDERPRYSVFLYCKERKCTGLLLAEHIDSAFETRSVVSKNGSETATEHSTTSTTARLGISRIWTSASARRSGIAIKLLETTRRNFMKRMVISKTEIAFSQPTEMGTALARKWFGISHGWLVYKE